LFTDKLLTASDFLLKLEDANTKKYGGAAQGIRTGNRKKNLYHKM
jgi:hypothetical protein